MIIQVNRNGSWKYVDEFDPALLKSIQERALVAAIRAGPRSNQWRKA